MFFIQTTALNLISSLVVHKDAEIETVAVKLRGCILFDNHMNMKKEWFYSREASKT